MNIIVCNDTRTEPFPEDFDWKGSNAQANAREQRESINMDQRLCFNLRKAGHRVTLFDGYEPNGISKVTDPSRGASRLTQLIAEHEAAGMVFDLHYFGNFDYGVYCLKQLRHLRAIPQDMKIIVYSRFIKEPNGDFPRRLVEECGIPLANVVDRHQKGIESVVTLFGRA